MKLLLLLFTAFCLPFCQPVLAQDRILDVEGNEYTVTVTEITPDSIRYKEITGVTQKVQAMPLAQVFMISFKNGTKQVFFDYEAAAGSNTENEAPPILSKQQYYQLGKLEARKYYKSNGAFWGTFGATFIPPLFPFGGIAAGTAVSLATPYHRKVITSNPEYKQNPDFMLGYNNQAKKKKLASAAGGLGAAVGVIFVVAAISLSGSL